MADEITQPVTKSEIDEARALLLSGSERGERIGGRISPARGSDGWRYHTKSVLCGDGRVRVTLALGPFQI